ncbi:MAG: hypothetical protein SFZ03_06350 [Candidatus Melainabacteria bacterium]|nr:hypothetical protein [Candidatus Melainabacteria bacterium]
MSDFFSNVTSNPNQSSSSQNTFRFESYQDNSQRSGSGYGDYYSDDSPYGANAQQRALAEALRQQSGSTLNPDTRPAGSVAAETHAMNRNLAEFYDRMLLTA